MPGLKKILAAAVVISVTALGWPVRSEANQNKQITKDEVYFAIARKINSVTESQVSALVAEIDGVIEITGIAPEPDGISMVTVKERAPSNASSTNKSIRLKFAPPAEGSDWKWTDFENNKRFYEVEKLFPYTKGELDKRRQLATTKWTAYLTSITKQSESAFKALDTAKAVIKSDPAPLQTLVPLRERLSQAMKDNDKDGIMSAYGELAQQEEPIVGLGETHTDLKTNDAYLRLLDEYKNSIKATAAAKKDYLTAVAAYNEQLVRLPFSLVAYGLQFTKMEANVEGE
ncbi:MAG: LemA family protein [Blastocatellales bacterium]